LSEGANCAEHLQDPQNQVQIIDDDPLTPDAPAGQRFVQISPQRVKLKLRPGIESRLIFQVFEFTRHKQPARCIKIVVFLMSLFSGCSGKTISS
jgi:hypothetical protein